MERSGERLSLVDDAWQTHPYSLRPDHHIDGAATLAQRARELDHDLGVVSDRCVVPNIQIVITANTEQRRLVIGQCGSTSFLSGTRAGALLTNLVQTGEPIEARRAAAIRDYLVPD
jgi:hypothetical protein